MANNDQIAAALSNIAQVLQALQQQQQPPPPAPPVPPPAPRGPVLELFDSNTPFDLSSRAGAAAFTQASSALDDKWDGTIAKLPNFIIALKNRANESRWDAATPHGILTYSVPVGSPAVATNYNILTEYHSIPMTAIQAAHAARADARANQNARCFYHCVKASLEGDIRETVYEQLGNLPTVEDGGLLLKTVTGFSMASSLQLTLQTVRDIQALEPSDYEYKISRINTKLTHLFLLSASVNRQLTEPEKLQYALTIYSKIKQPEAWAQWVRNQVEAFDEGRLVNTQALLNSAVLKQLKIANETGDFCGRSTTMHEDVVAMMAAKRPRTIPSGPTRPPRTPNGTATKKLPPFIRHFKDSATGKNYSVGDTKLFDGVTWHYCGCPRHKDNRRWHTHPADACHVRKKSEAEGNPPVTDATANPAVDGDSAATSTTETDTVASDLSSRSDATALLDHVLSSVDNVLARELIADALSAIQDS